MNNKTYKSFIFKLSLLAIIFMLLIGCAQQSINERPPIAINGVIDLSNWDLDEYVRVNLEGTWEFYWEQLIEPSVFSETRSTESLPSQRHGLLNNKNYINVPSAWPQAGYATYRLIVVLEQQSKRQEYSPEKQELISQQITNHLALHIPKLSTAYTLWINNELIASNGIVGMESDATIPHTEPKFVTFDTNNDSLDIVIQASNFHHSTGGILKNISLGTEDFITTFSNWQIAFDLIVFGSLFVVGIYHLIFYFYRKKEASNLYFGVFSIIVGIRALLVGTAFIFQLFPNFNWELALTIEYLTFYLGTPIFILYLRSILPQEISLKVIQLSIVISIFFSALVVLTPVRIYSQFNIYYQIIAIFLILYLLYALILACTRRRDGAIAIGLAVLFFVSTIINDILYENSLIFQSKSIIAASLSSWGFLVFVLSQSIILSRKFTKAFTRIEEMTENLKQLNESLEDKVNERTLALETSNKKLEQAYTDISNMEQSRSELLTNISHDLKSPMASVLGYANAILDGTIDTPEQQKRYLQRIKERIQGLNHLTEDLFDLTQLEARKLKLQVSTVSVEHLLQFVYKKYLQDVKSAQIQFIFEKNDSPCILKTLSIEVDIERIDRAFANIIYNAIKFTPAEGTISLDYDCLPADNPSEIIFKITDNGVGITADDLPQVFNRFFTGSKSRTNSGSGLGLSITKEIIEYHNGRIWVTSTPSIETTFYISLPLLQTYE
ncbi:sensor histidine kinase [Desulfuribacillus alkaliarsenatis]|uniref:histidine kinase n=1 Tax=Desulfuribacillus alkaliarsenatis TaxID=766136 RepID=A0A1E5G286_9FIRM|nr:sensor histidine kinase [Desulfuribacillus alkaliarsenatis]OEF97085.1 hypothetical protein BHF68_05660 [Desulfuribacillus alkaliarsenatis]